MTIDELRRQVRHLKETKGFDISLKQRLAYLMSEVASEVLKLSRNGNRDVGEMSPAEIETVKEDLGMEIYDVVLNLCDLATWRAWTWKGLPRKRPGSTRAENGR